MLETFKTLLNRHLKNFMTSYQTEEKMFLQLAKDIKEHSLLLENKLEKYEEGAFEIVNVMAKETYLVDVFTQGIADTNIEVIQPGQLIEKIDVIPDIDSKNSAEIIQAVSYALEQMTQEENFSFAKVFYDNYFGEYVSNIFLISAMESFYSQKELFFQLKSLLNEKNQSEELFTVFMEATETLKEDLIHSPYTFENI